MTEIRRRVLDRLNTLDIEYALIEHAPALTMADCQYAMDQLGALMPKNLFLAPRNLSAHYLLIARPFAPFKTGPISRQIGASRLSFAPEAALFEHLHTRPGAISPLGLIFDTQRAVRLVMDRTLKGAPALIFHPCDNAASLRLSGDDFFGRFLPSTGHEITWVDIED